MVPRQIHAVGWKRTGRKASSTRKSPRAAKGWARIQSTDLGFRRIRFGLRTPNTTPTGLREGRRASEARNASQSVAGTTRDERDAASRRPPPLARRDAASRAPRGVRSLEQRTTLAGRPFLAVHPACLHRGLVGVLLGTLNHGAP